jgi:hypothetical protein
MQTWDTKRGTVTFLALGASNREDHSEHKLHILRKTQQFIAYPFGLAEIIEKNYLRAENPIFSLKIFMLPPRTTAAPRPLPLATPLVPHSAFFIQCY